MIELNLTFFIQLINFLLLLGVLNFLVYRPIREIVRKRGEKIAGDLSEIEGFNNQAEQKVEDYQAALDQARREGDRVRNELKQEGTQEEKNLLAQAADQGAADLEAARKDIASESDRARQDLTRQVDDYARKVADKVLVNA